MVWNSIGRYVGVAIAFLFLVPMEQLSPLLILNLILHIIKLLLKIYLFNIVIDQIL